MRPGYLEGHGDGKRRRGRERDGLRIVQEGRHARDVAGAEGPRLHAVIRPAGGLIELPAQRQMTGEQAKADRDRIGMQVIPDEMIESMAVLEFLNDLFDAPALAGGVGELLRAHTSRRLVT